MAPPRQSLQRHTGSSRICNILMSANQSGERILVYHEIDRSIGIRPISKVPNLLK